MFNKIYVIAYKAREKCCSFICLVLCLSIIRFTVRAQWFCLSLESAALCCEYKIHCRKDICYLENMPHHNASHFI